MTTFEQIDDFHFDKDAKKFQFEHFSSKDADFVDGELNFDTSGTALMFVSDDSEVWNIIESTVPDATPVSEQDIPLSQVKSLKFSDDDGPFTLSIVGEDDIRDISLKAQTKINISSGQIVAFSQTDKLLTVKIYK